MMEWIENSYGELLVRLHSLPQAMLIHGPRGLGKLSLARRFAQRILCESPDPGRDACGRCDGCRWFLADQHPDYRQVEPEAISARYASADDDSATEGKAKKKPSIEIKIEQVRELAGFLNIGSHRARRRIALFHPAESMNLNSANALLKSLEEPAPGACLILVSHQARRLLPTIRSRCVTFAVHAPEPAVGAQWLAGEGVAAAEQWFAFSGGAPLSARDLAGSDTGKRISAWRALLEQRPADLVDRLGINDREQLEPFVELLQKWAYDQSAASFGVAAKFGLPAGRKARHAVQADARHWLRYARRLGQARRDARHPLNPRLFLVEVLAEMPD